MADNATISPLGELLQDWMWSQRPPWTRRKLALAIHRSPGTIYGWFTGAQRPELAALVPLADVTGLPIMRVLEAAGYRLPVPLPGRDDSDWSVADAFNVLIERLRQEPTIPDERRQAIIAGMLLTRDWVVAAGSGVPETEPPPLPPAPSPASSPPPRRRKHSDTDPRVPSHPPTHG